MKICLNCGDTLLDAAKKCPSCGTKDGAKGQYFPIVDKNDKEAIEKIVASVPHPKAKITPEPSCLNDNNDNIARCPKCGSTSLSADKKGFGIGKAVVGAAILSNPIGLVAGNIGAKKVRITCLKCGYQYWAGKK